MSKRANLSYLCEQGQFFQFRAAGLERQTRISAFPLEAIKMAQWGVMFVSTLTKEYFVVCALAIFRARHSSRLQCRVTLMYPSCRTLHLYYHTYNVIMINVILIKYYFKGIFHKKKIKILSSFTQPQVVENLYEFLSSAEPKGRYFEE